MMGSGGLGPRERERQGASQRSPLQRIDVNFGFYTRLWDHLLRMFRTGNAKDSKKIAASPHNAA